MRYRKFGRGFGNLHSSVNLSVLSFPTNGAEGAYKTSLKEVSQLLKSLAEGDDTVLAIKGLGPKALEDIKKLLKKEGYSLP